MPPKPAAPKRRPPNERGDPPATTPIGGEAHVSIGGVPVRVSASFWWMTLMLSLQQRYEPDHQFSKAIVWASLMFPTVLFSELAHAIVAKHFGGRPAITLYALGGVTNGIPIGITRGRMSLIAIAGPVASLAIAFGLFAVRHIPSLHAPAIQLLESAYFVNLAWGLLNLMPVLPFDGGHLLAAALGPRRILETTIVSMIVGGSIGIWCGLNGLFGVTLLFGAATANTVEASRRAWDLRRDQRDGLDVAVLRTRDLLARGEVREAMTIADDVVRRARTAAVRNGGWTAMAWAHVQLGEGHLAREALARVAPRSAVDPLTYAAVEDCAGDPQRARRVLDMARKHGLRSREMSKLHIDLCARDGAIDVATTLAIADVDLLGADEARAVLDAALGAGENGKGALLARRLFERHGDVRDALVEARARATLRDTEGTLAALERLRGAGGVDWIAVRSEPAFERLADHPRFVALVGDA